MTSPFRPVAQVTLQRGGREDLGSVMAVMESAFDARFGEAWTRSQCGAILPMSGVTLTLARTADGPPACGFSLQRTVLDESELLLLAVMPQERRRGVGRLLLDNFIEQAREEGATRAHLEVRDGNPAVDLYAAAGFVEIRRRRKYYRGSDGSFYDALTLALDL